MYNYSGHSLSFRELACFKKERFYARKDESSQIL